MKNLKIDRFYLVFGALMLVMAVLIIFTLRTIFGSLTTAGEISEELLQTQTPRVNKEQIDEALRLTREQINWALDLGL